MIIKNILTLVNVLTNTEQKSPFINVQFHVYGLLVQNSCLTTYPFDS